MYIFSYTTIPLCLSIFWWSKFRNKERWCKSLYVVWLGSNSSSIFPHLYCICTRFKNYEVSILLISQVLYYVFDFGYNAFKELYKIHLHESFFVVRAKKKLQFKCIRWRRRLPKNVLTDPMIELTDIITRLRYTERLRLVKYRNEDQDREFVFPTNAFILLHLKSPNYIKKRWQVELFFKWLKLHLRIKEFWEYYGKHCPNPN